MQRTSIIHYIDPSCISVTPNANGSADDMAVYVAKDTKIRVYSPRAGIGMEDNIYREWTLSGRNRRLAESNKPYTIYARLPKEDANNGYLVFAPKTEHNSQWVDKYSSVTPDGESVLYTESGVDVRVTSDDVWYVRLGDVSLPVDGKREVELDTGTLGTEQFNNEWALNPDVSPLSVALSAAINSQDAGPAPYVYWGQTLLLTARLVEGWTGTNIQRFDHWEIVRNSGDANADATWNAVDRSATFGELGVIYLNHNRGNGSTDDFNGSVNTTFIVNAMENTGTEENPIYAVLKSASIDIMAETWETYGLSLSSDMITYNPMTQEYSPSDGAYVKIRAANQKSETSLLTNQQVSGAGLVVEYSTVGAATEIWTAISFSGVSSAIAVARIPVSAFGQQSLNVRLRNSDDPEHNTGTELFRTTIAFLRDGEDSKEREWIFFRSSSAITFGNAGSTHPKPALISGGEVNPTGAAGNSVTNKNQDGWVPYKWRDKQQGVTSTYRYEYGAYRDYVKDSDSSSSGEDSSGYWGPFTDPVLWNHYGSDGVSYEVRWSDAFGVIDNIACNSNGVPKYRQGGGYDPWLTATLYKSVGGAEPVAFVVPKIVMHAYFINGTEVDIPGWSREATNASSLTLNNYDGGDITYIRYFVEFLNANNQVIASSSIARNLDGENVIRFDLDNEYDSIQYQGDGMTKVSPSATVQATAYLFDGTTDVSSQASFTISNRSGMSAQQATISGGVVTVSGLTSDGEVTIRAQYPIGSGKYYYNKFTVKKLIGIDKYDLVVTPNAVPVNTSNTVPDTAISVQVYRTPSNGGTRHLVEFKKVNNVYTNDYGLTLSVKDSLNNDLSETTSGTEVDTRTFNLTGTMATAADNVMIVLTKDSKTQDSETVPITHVHNGIDGSGSNAVKIDLDNEMDSIPCDSDGKVKSQTVLEVNARIYDGASPVSSGVAVSSVGAIAGVSAVTSLSNGVVNIQWPIPATGSGTPLSVDKFTSLIVLTWGGNSYYATFTANVVKSGEPGTTPTVFQLVPSPSQILFKRDSSGSIPSSTQNLLLSIKKSDGDGQSLIAVAASGLTVRYRTDQTPSSASDGTAWPAGGLSVSSSATYGNVYIAAFDGNGTFVDRETVAIVKDGENGSNGRNAQYIYLKGDAKGALSIGNEGNSCAVKINGGNNVATLTRGLNLVTINRNTLDVVDSVNYDTWSEAFGTQGAQGITNLIAKLNTLDNSVFVALVSADAIGWSDTLLTTLYDFGMSELPYTAIGRYPFAFIGYKGLGKGNGVTRMNNKNQPAVPVEFSAYFANGALTTKDGQDGQDMRENLIDNSESQCILDVANPQFTFDNNDLRFLTDKTFDPTKIPDNTPLSGQMRITFSGCTFADNTIVGIYLSSGDLWPFPVLAQNITANGTYDLKTENLTITGSHGTWDGKIHLRLKGCGTSGTVIVERVKLEVGEKCSAWCLSENDKIGPQGKVGRWIYYGGVFNANDGSKTFDVNDIQVPFFLTDNQHNQYRVFNFGINGSYTMAQMYAIQSSFDNEPWEVMTSDFQYLITKAIFSDQALLGSFVINGDWMISQTARSDSPSNDYTHFNPDYPDRQEPSATGLFNGDNFIPMYAINGNAGTTYQNAGVIGGFNINNNGLAIGTYDPNTWFNNPTNFAFLNTSAFRIARTDMYNQHTVDGAFVFMGQNCNPQDNNDDHDTAIYIYRRKVQYTLASELYKPAAQIISDNIAGINVALRLQGALQLHGGGVISQGCILEYRGSQYDVTSLNLSKGTTFVIKDTRASGDTVYFYLPTLSKVLTQLGMASETSFAIPITVIAHRQSRGFLLLSVGAYIRDNNDNIVNRTTVVINNVTYQGSYLEFSKCDVARLILISDGDNYYIQKVGSFT